MKTYISVTKVRAGECTRHTDNSLDTSKLCNSFTSRFPYSLPETPVSIKYDTRLSSE